MKRQLAAYAGTMIVMVGLDLLWLGIIAKPLYQQGIAHLTADKPNVPGGKTVMDWAAPLQ